MNAGTWAEADLLPATDGYAVNGLLYIRNATRRTRTNNAYGAVSQAGNIG